MPGRTEDSALQRSRRSTRTRMYPTTAALMAARSTQCARARDRDIERFWSAVRAFPNCRRAPIPPVPGGLPAGFLDFPERPRLRRTPMPAADRRDGVDLVVIGASVGG